MGFIHVLHKLCQEEREKASLGFLSFSLRLRKLLILLCFPYIFLSFSYSFLLSLMRLGGVGIQKNAQEKREKASPVFSFLILVYGLYICSPFFVYLWTSLLCILVWF